MKDITSDVVKKLRDCTGAGIMDCKRALLVHDGDIDKAIDELKKKGVSLAEKKSLREAKEGIVYIVINPNRTKCSIVEINCETDFVARQKEFKDYVLKVANFVLDHNIKSIDELKGNFFEDLELLRVNLVSKLGENIYIRRINSLSNESGSIGFYMHDLNGVIRTGSVICLNNYNDILAHDIAMQVVALNPEFISFKDVPISRIEYEKHILMCRTQELYKDKDSIVISKIIDGQINKIINNITLYGQFFIKNNKLLVKDVLSDNKLDVINMLRYEIGVK